MFDSHDWHEPSSDTCGLNALRVHGGGHIVDALMTRVEFRYLVRDLRCSRPFQDRNVPDSYAVVYGQVSSSFIPRSADFPPIFLTIANFHTKMREEPLPTGWEECVNPKVEIPSFLKTRLFDNLIRSHS